MNTDSRVDKLEDMLEEFKNEQKIINDNMVEILKKISIAINELADLAHER